MVNQATGVDAAHNCRGCQCLIVDDHGHARGCMLRESSRDVERRRGKTEFFPGMRSLCERCGHLMNDKQLRHHLCPKRLPA